MPLESLDRLREKVDLPTGRANVVNITKLKDFGYDVERLPYSIRVLLENASRHSGRISGATEAAHALAQWPKSIDSETPFMPERVLLQDYTGVPLVVDLAAMRDAAKRVGLEPGAVNSKVPVDLVIDHSIQVDAWGNDLAFSTNLEKEYERNSERYQLLKWARSSFKNMRVFPPGKGICHQFNLEYLSQVVASRDGEVFPDTLVGTDSHTTMVNGLGVLGWGVGGIEAEAVMLGEPYHMPIPKVFGVKFTGALKEGVTPTDLVLTVTERLRERNVVGQFVEYFGEGYGQLSVPDRATIGNMSPEYGATAGFFPVDGATLAYLVGTARPREHVEMVSRYAKQFGFFVTGIEPDYTEVIHIELDKIEPSIAGPRNPEERHTLVSVPPFARVLLDQRRSSTSGSTGYTARSQLMLEEDGPIHTGLADGAVVIAAITSCTNTSNPTVMVGAGLIAKRAVEAGISAKPWVKPSLAPGSTVVTDYLENAGLLPYLDRLGFVLVGYGCTTCIAEGTPVLMADGTSRRIEDFPIQGGAMVIAPTVEGRFDVARQSRLMDNGVRSCVELELEDGRTLTCTPDHKILCSGGLWRRADELRLGLDRAVVGPRTVDESHGTLEAGNMVLKLGARPRTSSQRVVAMRQVGPKRVFDLTVDGAHSFIAGTVAVHNCIGNSGPLAPEIEKTIKDRDLYVVAALSGNRNFEGRIHPLAKGAFLMSPMLVVAYALAGRIDFDFAKAPLGVGKSGSPIYLKDLWPSMEEVKKTVELALNPGQYQRRYADAMKGDERWEKLTSFEDVVYHWDDGSTYIRNPPWFDPSLSQSAKADVRGARVLALLEDKVTTDHISPAGTIPVGSPAGLYLNEHGVDMIHFSTYGSRRGNHEVLVRGGFSNIRIRNALAKGKEGGYTAHLPEGSVMTIYDAAMKYAAEKVPLVVVAGKQYGTGSSRDWAAKAPKLLGVRAVIAESFERIHRSNLVAMGVIPLQFKDGEGVEKLGLMGDETIDIIGLEMMQSPREWVEVIARGSGGEKRFRTLVRVDNDTEMQYVQSGGVLPYVFGRLSKSVH